MINIRKILNLGCAAVLFCSATSHLSADFSPLSDAGFSPLSNIEVSGGWRRDDFRSYIVAGDATDTVRGNNLDIWQVGLKGRWEPNFFGDDCGCWGNGLLVRGSAYWGWVNDGNYSHRINYAPGDLTPPVEFDIRRDVGVIDSGKTWDYKIGAGYLFDICDGIRIGPTVGYSYDKLRFRGSNIVGISSTNFTESINEYDQTCITSVDEYTCGEEGAKFTSKWQGPWVGVDAQLQFCDFEINAGYEYHWSDWRAAFTVKEDLTDCYHYSDKRRSNKSHGQEAFLNAHYNVNCFWVVGLGLEYKYYRQPTSTKFRPANGSLPDVGCSEDEVNKIRSQWRSFAITLDIGYLF